MNLTINMEKHIDAQISSKLCVNCDSCGSICPVGAIEEHERYVEGLDVENWDNVLPSSAGCPLGIVPQVIVEYINAGRLEDGAEYLYGKNPLAKVCAAVCNQYCKRSDRRGMYQGEATNIRALERYVLDKYPSKPQEYKVKYSEKIAIIGGGPAGLGAAHQLASLGYEVTIFEGDKSLGGSMSWEIPGFRLDKDLLDEEIAKILAGGIKVRVGVKVGQDITLEQLKEEYDVVVVATGASQGTVLNVEGADGDMVLDGVTVLRTINLEPENEFTAVGDAVVVIGGGRFAADVARTLVRKGKEVACVAMEAANNVQIDEEYLNAMSTEGIQFIPQAAPIKIERENGQVSSIIFGQVEFVKDEDGKIVSRISDVEGFKIPCDTIVFAVGRQFDNTGLDGIEVYPDGVIKTDKFNRTSCEGVFACGDIAGTSNSVVGAMTSGIKTAINVDAILRERRLPNRKANAILGNGIAGNDEYISIDEIAMIRPAKEEMIFSRSSKINGQPAEDIVDIIRHAGISENMPLLVNGEDESGNFKKVAIIGGGMAGITASIELAKKGYNPTIFEKTPCLGGRYKWLATDKRVDNDILDGELAKVEQAGIKVVYNASAGIKPSISELKAAGYDAILFAIGETAGRRPDMENNHAVGVFEMVSLASRLARNIVVNGIGNTTIVSGSDQMAVDIARKLKEYSHDVILVSKCSKEQLMEKTDAIMDALEEGVNLVTGTELVGIEAEKGKVKAVDLNILEKDLVIDVPCDTLVIGDSQMADTATIVARNPALKVKGNGSFETDSNLQTPIKGVLSIGDLDMPAIQAGLAGAEAVNCFFKGGNLGVDISSKIASEQIADTESANDQIPHHEIIEGKTMSDKGFEIGKRIFSSKQAKQEASRFISVGYHKVNSSRCIGCGICKDTCPEGAIEIVPCREVE